MDDRSVDVSRPTCVVVLAAGEGTRMRSSRPKPLHHLCGRPMVLYVLDAVVHEDVRATVVVVGHGATWVEKSLTERARADVHLTFVEQHYRHFVILKPQTLARRFLTPYWTSTRAYGLPPPRPPPS